MHNFISFAVMARATKILKRIWGLYFYMVFSALLLIMFPFLWILLRNESMYPYANRMRKLWAYACLALTGVFPKVSGSFNLAIHEPAIICSNHTSTLDIVFFGMLLDNRYKFVAKKEFKSIPIFGYFFKTIDIPVDRSTKRGAYKAYLESKQALEKGYKLVMFPEGTTSENPPQMVPFKNGPFKLAIDQKVPIVPVTFLNNWELFHYDAGFFGQPGNAKIIIHEPVSIEEVAKCDQDSLKQQIYYTIETPLKEAYESQFTVG